MLGMGKPVHIFQLGASVRKWSIWLLLPLLMRRRKEEKSKFNLVLNVVNYKCVKSNKWT
jgi:hypothetical protein